MIPRYPIRYGRISSLRGTGVTAAGSPGAAEYLSPALKVEGVVGSATLVREPYSLARGLEPLAGLPGAVAFTSQTLLADRQFTATGRPGFMAPVAMAHPDVSLGVSITFEEV